MFAWQAQAMLSLLSVVVLVPHLSTALDLTPSFALLQQAANFHIKEVTERHASCTTRFRDGDASQSVFAQVSKHEAVCTVVPPAVTGFLSITASVQLDQWTSFTERSTKPQFMDVEFVQPPIASSVALRHDSEDGSYILVTLRRVDGLKQIKDRLRDDSFVLKIDLSTTGEAARTLPGTHHLSDSPPALRFALPTVLPDGTYPTIVLLNSQPLPIHAPTMDPVTSVRSEQSFNASQAATTEVLTPQENEYTLILDVSQLTVSLSSPRVPLAAMSACSSDRDDDSSCGQGSMSSPAMRSLPSEDASALFVELNGSPVDTISVIVAVKRAEQVGSSGAVLEAGGDGKEATEDELEDMEDSGDEDEVVVLSRPGFEDDAKSLLRVIWGSGSGQSRQIVFKDEDKDDENEQGLDGQYSVHLLHPRGALVDASEQSALVTAHVSAEEPLFSVVGQGVFHRSESLSFNVARSGEPSDVPSVIRWELVYLSVPHSNFFSAPYFTSALYDADRPDMNFTAALGGAPHGLVTWEEFDTAGEQLVTVPVKWDVVPYDARWMVTVLLSVVSNGRISKQIFQEPPASTAPVVSAAPTASDALVGGGTVQGSASMTASKAHMIVYGAPNGACVPGTQRTAGAAKYVPVLEGALDEEVIVSILMRSSDGDRDMFTPPTPPFNASQSLYSIAVSHTATPTALVILSKKKRAVIVSGCGHSSGTYPWDALMDVPSTSPDVWSLHWQIPRLTQSSCTANIVVCPSLEPCLPMDASVRYSVAIHRLSDPILARPSSVSLTIANQTALLCAIPDAKATCSLPAASNILPRVSTHDRDICKPAPCDTHSTPQASVRYRRGERLIVTVAIPPDVASGSTITLGQRVFPLGPSSPSSPSTSTASVAFSLFDDTDRLSPFVPFFIRSRAHNAVTLDIPVSVILADGLTSAQLVFTLIISVLDPPASSPSPQRQVDGPASAAGPDDASGAEEASVQITGAELMIIAPAVTDAAPAQAPVGRSLQLVSASAPDNQAWLEDPLDNDNCEQCPVGSFAYSVDSTPCTLCPPGSAAPQRGMSTCLLCPPGTHTRIHGASSCSPCVHGSYAQLPGSPACYLCPPGFSTTSDAAATCDRPVPQTVFLGRQYALSVMISLRLSGTSIADVQQRLGVEASAEDIVRFLVSLDCADAFSVSPQDVSVTSISELQPRVLRVNMTTNIGVDSPDHATSEEIETAINIAQLSKDRSVGNLTWSHTTTALGADAEMDGDIRTEVQVPSEHNRPVWPAVVFPVIAGVAIIIGVLLLRVKPWDAHRQQGLLSIPSPSEMMEQSFTMFSAAIAPLMQGLRRSSYMSSGDVSSCGEDIETGRRVGDARKRPAVGDDNRP